MTVHRLVVCGTDTDVGKTVVSALLVQGLRATYWKPVQCGLEGGGDSDRVKALLDLPAQRVLPEAYRLAAPVSPHWAAAQEGQRIEAERLQLPPLAGPLVVETAGGLLVPLRLDLLQIEFSKIAPIGVVFFGLFLNRWGVLGDGLFRKIRI